ncbi:MAG TPA: endonuclease/exonuclease/phosphatase family protein, partial [Planctomycetaceae bacterium]|nr:endonuclease/exonuclease/phosphatase family protein [Planctomycetaceae bacterium]
SRVADAISEAEADLVLLQETTPESEAYLTSRLRGTYPHIAFRGHQRRYAAERFGILSRFPLRDVRFVPPQRGLFGFVVARAGLGEREIQIVNVHLQPFSFSAHGGIRAVLARSSAVEETHVREIEKVLAEIDSALPAVIAGDFNSLSWFAAPSRLRQRGYVDSFAEALPDPDEHPTWRWPVGEDELKLRIDYIFRDARLRTRASRIIHNGASDHGLLVSEFEFVP